MVHLYSPHGLGGSILAQGSGYAEYKQHTCRLCLDCTDTTRCLQILPILILGLTMLLTAAVNSCLKPCISVVEYAARKYPDRVAQNWRTRPIQLLAARAGCGRHRASCPAQVAEHCFQRLDADQETSHASRFRHPCTAERPKP